ERSRHPNAMLGVAIGCILMAGIVYYYLESGRSPFPEEIVASLKSRSTSTIESNRSSRAETLPSTPNAEDHEILTDTSTDAEKPPQPTATAAAPLAPKRETMAVPPPTAPAAATVGPSPRKPARTLEPEIITLLLNEAKKHISTGDVVTARMIFQ